MTADVAIVVTARLLAEVQSWLEKAAALPAGPSTFERKFNLVAHAREALETSAPDETTEAAYAELLGRVRVAERALDAEMEEMRRALGRKR